MKSTFKAFFKYGILLFGVLFLLWNCEVDTEPIQPNNQELSLIQPTIETFSLNELVKDNTFKDLSNSYGILQNRQHTKNGSSIPFKLLDTLGISFKTSSIKKITNTNYVSYTISMIEAADTSKDFSNLIIQETNGIKQIFTIRYFNTKSISKSSTNISKTASNSFSGNISMQSGINNHEFWDKTDGDGGGSGGDSQCEEYVEVCNTVNVWVPHPCGCGHMPGQTCKGSTCGPPTYAYYTLETIEECRTICKWEGYDDSAGSNSSGSNGSGGSSSSSSNGNSKPTDVATTPINPDGSDAFNPVLLLESLLNITDQNKISWLNTNIAQATSIYNFIAINSFTQQAKDFAKQAIIALMDDIPVIFDLKRDDIFQGNPLDFSKLNSKQRIATVVNAIKKAIDDNTVNHFDIHKLFFNLPLTQVREVAKVFVGGRLLDLRMEFGNYNNLQINEYPNDGRQVGPLFGAIGNYGINGYWFIWKFRTYNARFPDGGDAFFLFVKEKGQYNYENSDYFNDFMGF